MARSRGIAVSEMKVAAEFVESALGGQFKRGGDNHDYGFRTAQFHLRGETKIVLLQSVDEDSDLQRFLDERGRGVHHLTFMSDDVVETEARLSACGCRTTGTKLDEPGWRETYLGPSHGVKTVLQFADSVLDWHTPWRNAALDDLLQGRQTWDGASLQSSATERPSSS